MNVCDLHLRQLNIFVLIIVTNFDPWQTCLTPLKKNACIKRARIFFTRSFLGALPTLSFNGCNEEQFIKKKLPSREVCIHTAIEHSMVREKGHREKLNFVKKISPKLSDLAPSPPPPQKKVAKKFLFYKLCLEPPYFFR